MENLREMRGKEIASHEGQIKRINDNEYEVHSQSSDRAYIYYHVRKTETGWVCTCPDFQERGSKCKHIWAVGISYNLHQEVFSRVISPIENRGCLSCKSLNLVRDGIRHNKRGDIQRYTCKTCGYRLTVNVGFEKMHATPQAITTCMQLYFTQESYRNIQKFLRLQGIKVNHTTIYRWIKKYTQLMDGYLSKI